MDFFHVPSFEDHFTLKIWVKNWNLKVNRYLFRFIYNLNDLFNSELTQEMINRQIEEELLQDIFPHKIWTQDPIRFQLFIQKEFNSQKQSQGQFFKKMHFLIFLVEISNLDSSEIQDILTSLKKFAYLKDNVSILILFFCEDPKLEPLLQNIQYSKVLKSLNVDKDLFKKDIAPLFFKVLREKLEQSPKLENSILLANKQYLSNGNSPTPIGVNEGKILKLRGDLSLIFDSLEDGEDYYEKASIIFNQKNLQPVQHSDKLTIWQGSIKEAQAALIYQQLKQALKRSNSSDDEEIKILQEQIITLYNEAFKFYMKENKTEFLVELVLKILGVFSLLKNKLQFIEKFFLLRSLDRQENIDPRVYLYVGDLAHNTALDRLAICSLFECTRKSELIPSLKTITQECFSLSARILKIDLESYQNDYQMLDLLPKQITQAFLKKLVQLNQLLGNTEKTLHYYLLIMKKFDENEEYFKKITEQVLWEVPFYQHQYDILPFLQRIEPVGRAKEFRKLRMNADQEQQRLEQSVFIYDPRNKNKFVDLNWVAQQECEIKVFLTNPLPIYVKIDSLSLETESVDTANYSTEITLTPLQKNIECKFKMRPVGFGIMKIKGVKIRIGNLIYFNAVDSRGVGTLYKCLKKDNPFIFEQFYEQFDINLDAVEVAESVPLIEVLPSTYFPETLFYNENIFLCLKVTNFSKMTAGDFAVLLKIDYENGAPVQIHQIIENLELDYSKNFNIQLKLHQGEGGQNNQSTKLEFQKRDDTFYFQFANKNLIERIYKVTLSIESKFSSNKNFVSCKKFVKSFKNYKLFDVTLHLIDLFGISDLRIKDDWKFIDISDQLQFYFEIKTKFSNIATSNITIFLRNKFTKESLQKIVLSEKNVIKFSESRKGLQKLSDLNQKYELYWEISENQRSGIIHFSYPLVFKNSFSLEFDYKNDLKINQPLDFSIKGSIQDNSNGISDKEQFCQISLTSKRQSNKFLQGKTKFWFKSSFKKIYRAIFCEQDEYHLYVIVKNYESKQAMIFREVILIQLN